MEDLLSLVQDSRRFLEQFLPEKGKTHQFSVATPAKKMAAGEIKPTQEIVSEPIEANSAPIEPPKVAIAPIQRNNESKMGQLLKEIAPSISYCEPYPPVVLLYFEKQERFFLEKVAASLCQIKIPAMTQDATQLEKNIFLSSKWILIPSNHLAKISIAATICRGKAVHTFIPTKQGAGFLVLHPLIDYQHNEELKRSLWNQLKNLLR